MVGRRGGLIIGGMGERTIPVLDVLSGLCHCILLEGRRLRLADELIAIGVAAGHGVFAEPLRLALVGDAVDRSGVACLFGQVFDLGGDRS